MTFQTFCRYCKVAILLGSFFPLFTLNATAQGIAEMGGAYSGSAKLMPTNDSAQSLGRIFKQGSQNAASAASSSPSGAASSNISEDQTIAVNQAIKESNKDCLLAQEKEKAGKLLEAQKLYAKALAIRRRYWGSTDVSQATILLKIAELHQRLGNPTGAEFCLKEALAIYSKHFGPGAFEVVPILEQIAKIAMAQKKYEEAEGYYERVLALQERRNGPDAHKTFVDRLNLIDSAIYLKDYKEAKTYLDKTQESYVRLSSQADHKVPEEQKDDYLFLIDRYISAVQALNKPEEAQIYVNRAAALRAAK
jgi:tetratricopeptide (TPR) repeat protein